MMKYNLKQRALRNRFIALLLITTLLVSALPAYSAYAASVLYAYKETQSLAKGVTYELNRQMTDAGMLDVHVLSVSLDDPYIYVGPVESQKELGLKETTYDLLSAANVIAGTNGDFFGLAGTHSVSFGPVVQDGQLKSVSTSTNASSNEFAMFYLVDNNIPFVNYLKANVYFFINGVNPIEISAYNKISSDFEWPVIVDRQYMADTLAIDQRFPGLLKIVANNGYITYISRGGETVSIPENGCVLILPARMAEAASSIYVGSRAELVVNNSLSLDFQYIKSAIGGGGVILSNGQVVHDSGTAIAGRQPRTVVGFTYDRKTMILMTVDGRTHSIGATHDEMAALLKSYGVFDAMHLDGGGSSTMVLKNPETGEYGVANTLSDGAQRRIVNALGIFDRSPVGDMDRLALNLSQTDVIVGTPVTADVFGQDAYLHRIDLPPEGLVELTSEGKGSWDGTTFVPETIGVHIITARYGEYTVTRELNVHTLAELQCQPTAVHTLEGMYTDLSFSGVSADGLQAPADNAVNIKVVPPHLGVVEDGRFLALAAGAGCLEAEVNGVYTYVPLSVGGYGRVLDVLGGTSVISFSNQPDTVTGNVWHEWVGGKRIARMQYNFQPSNVTQAAYLEFETPEILPGEPMALRMSVMGDGSGNWLRGKVTDAAGTAYNIDFTQNMDFFDWRTVTAILPREAVYPLRLDRIYMVSLTSGAAQNHVLYFDNLEALYEPEFNIVLPEGNKYSDPLRKNLYQEKPDASAGVYDFDVGYGMPYAAQKLGNAAVLTLSASKGGLYATNANQWLRMAQDINRINPSFIILLMDENPLYFAQQKEFELLHKMLTDLRKNESGLPGNKPVFVVSASGTETVCTMKDGVRYIDLKRPVSSEGQYSGQSPAQPFNLFASIRFKMQGNEILFDYGE